MIVIESPGIGSGNGSRKSEREAESPSSGGLAETRESARTACLIGIALGILAMHQLLLDHHLITIESSMAMPTPPCAYGHGEVLTPTIQQTLAAGTSCGVGTDAPHGGMLMATCVLVLMIVFGWSWLRRTSLPRDVRLTPRTRRRRSWRPSPELL